jgi:hypothetical protein
MVIEGEETEEDSCEDDVDADGSMKRLRLLDEDDCFSSTMILGCVTILPPLDDATWWCWCFIDGIVILVNLADFGCRIGAGDNAQQLPVAVMAATPSMIK